MKLSRKTTYAIFVMFTLAKKNKNENVTMKEIAENENISLKYLEQIVNVLCKSGLIKSYRGSRGGYSLSMSADKYTLGSIIRVTEGDFSVDSIENADVLNSVLNGFCDNINKYMDSITIGDLIEKEKIRNEIYDYCI